MEVFKAILSNEQRFYSDLESLLPREKVVYHHRKVKFVFYSPRASVVNSYVSPASISHRDFSTLGKVVISGKKLLLLHMDLVYFGVTGNGTVYYLGRSITDLSLRRRRVFQEMPCSSPES
ncbi:A31R conserved protein [Western grey kangaroopox virus]|uniref:A31R conserved protein n=1 Tax=Western grey kangaroopox virus TaxID=1566307 RepID=A0A2C9DST8_9POXV|nr:A31R conserved protein [Western grey kangaroopox virus]ATI21071.1 A31R conserved protein [Western grey kangaroopox virus]